MRHILLTNDFPPKVGGIQSYLWELWRRLPPDQVTVFTAAARTRRRGTVPALRSRQGEGARAATPAAPGPSGQATGPAVGAEAVVIDPALPLGLIGPFLGLPYAVVLHGAEVTVPGRLPVSRQLLAWR